MLHVFAWYLEMLFVLVATPATIKVCLKVWREINNMPRY